MKTFRNVNQVRALCILVRKGIGSRTGPGLSTVIEHRETEQHETGKAREIDGLWDEPFTLLEECCFRIRESIENPTPCKIHQLRLPKKLTDMLLFLNVAREVSHIITHILQ